MISEIQRRANAKYDKKTKKVLLRVNPETEPEIAKKLDSVPNKNGYIKNLIRQDIEREGTV